VSKEMLRPWATTRVTPVVVGPTQALTTKAPSEDCVLPVDGHPA